MGACQQKSKAKKDQPNQHENRKKVLLVKRSIQSTGKSVNYDSQRTIKTEMLMKHENKDIILEKIVKATQPFTRIYSMLNQYKQTTVGDDIIITIQHNVNTQVRQARFINRSKENDQWVEKFLDCYLDHPNIVRIYEYYQDEEHHIFVQEQLAGVTLGEYIKPSEQIKENVAAQLIIQILQAIQYLHQNQFVHGRISSHSFQFSSDADPVTLKLTDYRNIFIKDELNMHSLMFIAPELLTIIQQEKFTKEGDIWACGILSYTILSSSCPYQKCKTMQNLSNQILRGSILFDSINFDKISNTGKEFVKKLLARLQTQRPTAQQALNDTWLHNYFSSRKQQQNSKETLSKFSQCKKMNNLQFRIMIHMINVFFSQTCSQLINTFNDFDLDKDGKVNMQEMLSVYKSTGQKEELLQEVKNLFEKLDSNHSGDIDFHEFLIGVIDRKALLTNTNIELTFQTFNTSRNGRLSEQELSNVLQLSVEQIREDFPPNNLKKDGKANFDLKSFKSFMNELL